jgi:hypothetical protein
MKKQFFYATCGEVQVKQFPWTTFLSFHLLSFMQEKQAMGYKINQGRAVQEPKNCLPLPQESYAGKFN